MRSTLLINICIIIIDIILIINLLNYKKLNTKVNLLIQLNSNLNNRCNLLYEYIKLLEQENEIKEGKKNERKNTNRRNKKDEE